MLSSRWILQPASQQRCIVPRPFAKAKSLLRRRQFSNASPRQQTHKPQDISTSSKPSSQSITPNEEITISIPGPSWLFVPLKPLTYPLNVYNRAQNKRPYLTQFVSSLIIYFLGDLSSQLIQQPAPTVDAVHHDPSDPAAGAQPTTSISRAWHNYDPARSLRAITIGGIFSIPSYHWFLLLSSMFPAYSRIPRLALQVLIAQVCFAPFFNSYFFGMQSLLSPRPGPKEEAWRLDASGRIQDAWERIKQTVPISWWNSCKFWPVVTAFSFTFVRPQSRSVFAGVVAIGWQTYLGLVNQRAVAAEKRRLEQ